MTTPEPDTADTAEWEESDEPDAAMDAPADTTPTDEQPATPPTPPHPGMEWDAANSKWIQTEPRNREQRYRQQLRATEVERDQLKERLDKRDRAEVEHLVANRLIDPQDLWAGGVSSRMCWTPNPVTSVRNSLTKPSPA